MTALFLATALPGQPPRRRAVVSTATPGLYLTRHRHDCPHHDEEDYEPGVCPACQPWEWQVIAACGLNVSGDYDLNLPLTLPEAKSLAAGLGRTGVRWDTGDLLALYDQITTARATAVADVLRRHGRWVPDNVPGRLAEGRAHYARLLREGP
jgi:hypothetical protein